MVLKSLPFQKKKQIIIMFYALFFFRQVAFALLLKHGPNIY